MNTITTKDGTQIFYRDWGAGQPIVFHHGWPLSGDDWDNQMLFFLSQARASASGLQDRPPKHRQRGATMRHWRPR
jgi:pimeloyl-ACP methyl ester carboxylesterase